MPQLQDATSISQVVPPFICFGMLFMGLIIFSFIYSFVRDRLYLTMSVLALGGAVFVFCESMILLVGRLARQPGAWPCSSIAWNRWQSTLFLFAIPSMLGSLLVIGPRWKKPTGWSYVAGLFLAIGFSCVAFLAPDLYVSVTQHREDWMIRQGDYGRGMQGPLYSVRDGLLALLILYAVCCFVIDMIRHRRLRYLLPSFLGLLLAIYGAAIDIVSTHTDGRGR